MISAIYARKSTDQSAVADEAKSVRRQVEHARAFALRRGWTVDERFVFVDDGISGAEFSSRPGFVRLMNALRPRPSFEVLIMSEESRLGREAIETAYALKQIITAGVRVWFYLEDRERTLESPTDKILMSLTAYVDELERDRARQRMIDTMTRKARAGHVTGGQCFGYDNVEVYAGADVQGRPQRSHVEQRINETEAAVVRRIFELAAAGVSQPGIAKQLNAEGLPAPKSQQDRPRAWVQSSVHAVLFRERYRGQIVWNRTRKRDAWGQRRGLERAEGEWIRVDAPQLRIVSEELWDAAHAAIAAARSTMHLRPAARDRESKYLLPGLARCAWCNGGLHVRTRCRARGERAGFYACTSHFNRGEAVCRNLVQLSMRDVDRAVLDAIGQVLTRDVADEIVDGVRQALEPTRRRDDPRERIAAELEALEAQEANLSEAIAIGGNLPALVARLQAAHERRQALARQLRALGEGPVVPRVDWRATERRVRRLVGDWRALLARHVGPETRQFLRDYLEAPIRFTPILEEARRGYHFEGAIGIGGILAGTIEVTSLGVPGRT